MEDRETTGPGDAGFKSLKHNAFGSVFRARGNPIAARFDATHSRRRRTMSDSKTPMTPKAAARIQAAEAKRNGGGARKGGFAGRAQRAAAKGGGAKAGGGGKGGKK